MDHAAELSDPTRQISRSRMSDAAPRVEDRAVAALVEALAEPLAERIKEILGRPARSTLVTAGDLAEILGITVDTVYRHKDKLGAIALGDGARPRLRFDVDKATAAWAERQPAPDAPEPSNRHQGGRRRRPSASSSLLPVRRSVSEQGPAA